MKYVAAPMPTNAKPKPLPIPSALRVAAWTVAVLVALSILYVASAGPAWAMWKRKQLDSAIFMPLYSRPFRWACGDNEPLKLGVIAYAEWWDRRWPDEPPKPAGH